ncbi:MAG: heavy-metal-associated domain-containing protein, partial [Deltaproteobacteria bacterium]|nr:heavy-metal-associated domain-containing protein [Deltaproteobacteria bacterium]
MKFIDTIALVFLLSFGFASAATAAEPEAKTPEAAATKSCEMKIEGMTCGSCEAKVKEAVKDLALSAEIDSKTGM